MVKRRKRRLVTLTVTVSLHPGLTKADAKRELRTRVNDLTCWSSWIEQEHVRVRKVR